MSFDPVLVTTLIAPPAAPPDSADRPLLMIWNSRTISGDRATRAAPVVSSVLSSPSIEIELLRGRNPPNVKLLSANGDPDFPWVPPFDWGFDGATPGASNVNSR